MACRKVIPGSDVSSVVLFLSLHRGRNLDISFQFTQLTSNHVSRVLTAFFPEATDRSATVHIWKRPHVQNRAICSRLQFSNRKTSGCLDPKTAGHRQQK